MSNGGYITYYPLIKMQVNREKHIRQFSHLETLIYILSEEALWHG